jgi:hypothetical protein
MSPTKHKRAAAGRFVPRFETLEDRCCPSVTLAQDGDELHIEGDDASDTIAIVASGSVVTVSIANAQGQAVFAQTFLGIEDIEVDLEDGNDTVFLHLNGFGQQVFPPIPVVQAAVQQNMAMIRFMAQMNFNMMAGFVGFGDKEMDIELDGEDGFDRIFISANQFRLNNNLDLDIDDFEGRALLVPRMLPPPGQPVTQQPPFFILPF